MADSAANSDRQELADLVTELAVVHGKVTLSSGKEADYYVDLRRATLHHRAGALIGSLMRELVADWDFASVGGLTMGADPVAMAIMHAQGRPIGFISLPERCANLEFGGPKRNRLYMASSHSLYALYVETRGAV